MGQGKAKAKNECDTQAIRSEFEKLFGKH